MDESDLNAFSSRFLDVLPGNLGRFDRAQHIFRDLDIEQLHFQYDNVGVRFLQTNGEKLHHVILHRDSVLEEIIENKLGAAVAKRLAGDHLRELFREKR